MISSKDFFVVIPARYDSSRFPGKVLEEINNISMLENVFNNAKKSKASAVYIATDSQRVYKASKKFTNDVFLTSSANRNGTERIAELAELLNWNQNTLVVNLQADQPFLMHDNIDFLAALAEDSEGLSTLYYPLSDSKLNKDKNTVKISISENIKFYRDVGEIITDKFFKHIGIYAYHVRDLILYKKLPPSNNEISLSLEQYRFIDNNIKIHAYLAKSDPGISIDSIDNINEIRGVSN